MVAVAGIFGATAAGSAASGEAGRGVGALVVVLVLLVGAAGVGARAVVDRRPARTRPAPGRLGDEPALVVPRDTGTTTVSSWTLAGLGAVVLLGGAAALALGRWPVGVVAVLVGLGTVWLGSPHRRDLAGGLWLTPTRLVHSYRGRSWTLSWDDALGAQPGPPRPVVLVGADRLPAEERHGPPGRAWRRTRAMGGTGLLGLETEGLPLSESDLVGLLRRAVEDRAFRSTLGAAG